jgi:hypothetical protein
VDNNKQAREIRDQKERKMASMEIANTILQQLGGNKFIAMTGSKNFLAIDNGLKMNLAKNNSGANILTIKLTGDDLYDMEFIKFTSFKFNIKTMTTREEKVETISISEGVYDDKLAEIFTRVTGLHTRL